MELGAKRGRGNWSDAHEGRSGERRGLRVATEESCLMTHGRQDASREPAVVGVLGQAEGLEEVPLCQAVTAGVVGHPAREEGCLRCGREQSPTDLLGVPAAQERCDFGAEVLDRRVPCMVTAEAVVQFGEHVGGGFDRGHVSEANAESVLALSGNGWLGRYEPSEGRFVPRGLGRLGL